MSTEISHDMAHLHESNGFRTEDLRTFDTMCLPKIKAYTPSQIKFIRKKSHASQAVFAMCLNTSVSTIRQWEQGTKKPNGIALKLLSLVREKGLRVLLEP